MTFKKKRLKNGLTIITAPIKDSPSVTVLVIVHTGSKYETKEINGISHFLEHMCFKGTVKRPKAINISRELDSIGSQSNAFTDREITGYYAKAHPKHFSKILDIVSDIYLNPVFDEKEVEREKGVIIEEINMYEDLPQRIISEIFMEALYGDQPAGWGILGKKENILKIKKEDFINYRKKHYVAEATTVIIAGNFDGRVAVKEAEKAFKNISTWSKLNKKKVIEKQNHPFIKIKHKETDQTHIVLGVRCFDSEKDKKNYALKVLNSVLSGGMSSRLFQKLREEMGVGYYVRSNIDEFTDHEHLAVSTGVDNSRVKEVVEVILSEMKKLVYEKVSKEELKKAKDYLTGNLYLGLESSDALAGYYAMFDILGNELLTPFKFSKKIQEVTSKDVQNVAREIFVNNRLNMAIVGNIKNKEDLNKIFKF